MRCSVSATIKLYAEKPMEADNSLFDNGNMGLDKFGLSQ